MHSAAAGVEPRPCGYFSAETLTALAYPQVPSSSDNLDGTGRVDSEESGFGASDAPFELRALEIALDVV